jgi:hypothetical protein
MRKIRVLSKKSFSEYLEQQGINEGNIEHSNCYYICIEPTGGPNSEPIFKETHFNVLPMIFDDVEKDEKKWGEEVQYFFEAKAMTAEQGQEIVNFIKQIHDNSECIIYCTHGESRSGAVGSFATKYFEQDYTEFLNDNPKVGPNPYVLDTLMTLSKT